MLSTARYRKLPELYNSWCSKGGTTSLFRDLEKSYKLKIQEL